MKNIELKKFFFIILLIVPINLLSFQVNVKCKHLNERLKSGLYLIIDHKGWHGEFKEDFTLSKNGELKKESFLFIEPKLLDKNVERHITIYKNLDSCSIKGYKAFSWEWATNEKNGFKRMNTNKLKNKKK